MEYCMDSVDINFTIKAENCKAALAALNKWAEKKYSSLQHGLTDLGWSAENISNGDVAIFLFDGERLHGANIMFEILAPHVAEGSYISMHGQDNEYWQWYFDGKKLVEKPGQLVFD